MADGAMVSYPRMTSWQRAAFAVWNASPQVDRVARHQLEDADRVAAQESKKRCGYQMTIGPATGVGFLLLVCVLSVGCGSTHPSAAAVAACLGAAGDRAEAGVIEQAYRTGRLGSAATVRSESAALGPLPGAGNESFVRKDGTMVPWTDMDDAQQRTFSLWSHASKEAAGEISTEAFRASQRAAASAKAGCGA